MRWAGCFGTAMALAAIGGCTAPAPSPPGPVVVAPDAQDLLQDKAHAFQAGVAAGERQQARRDAAALASARAALIAETAAPSCATPSPAAAAPSAPTPKPAAAPPGNSGLGAATPAAASPSYTPGGPAVPVAPAN